MSKLTIDRKTHKNTKYEDKVNHVPSIVSSIFLHFFLFLQSSRTKHSSGVWTSGGAQGMSLVSLRFAWQFLLEDKEERMFSIGKHM